MPLLRPMRLEDVHAVWAMESATHPHPWSMAHMRDSLAAGHAAWVLEAQDASTAIVGYLIAMAGVEEAHLLSIAVDRAYQGRGLAQHLLTALATWARSVAAACVWLEVRESNASARRLYERWGFETVSLRKRYYPTVQGEREHAVVMRWTLPEEMPHALD